MNSTKETPTKDTNKRIHRKNSQKKALSEFKIFRVETDEKSGREKIVTMTKFHAENDKDAYERLKKYRRIANKEYTYYYCRTGLFSCKDRDGCGIVHFDTFNEMKDYMLQEKNGLFRRMSHLFKRIVDWACGILRSVRHGLQRMFIGHSETETYGIFDHILDDLEFNLPILSRNCKYPTVQFIDEASRRILKGVEKTEGNNDKMNDDESINLARKIMKDVIDGLYEDVVSYRFFSRGGIFSSDKGIPKDIEDNLKKRFPYVPGTYKVPDYVKLNSLIRKHKNRIFNTLSKYSDSLWS